MARFLLLCFAILLAGAATAQTSLNGKVTDGDTGEPIIFGNVALYKNGVLITGTETDFDGNYNFTEIDPGTYDVEVSYVGYQPQRVTGIQVLAGKANRANVELSSGGGVVLEEVVVTEYQVPLIEQDNTTSGSVVTSEQIRSLPTRNINALAATSAGIASADEGDDISIRGSRDNATDYYIDGIRVQGNLIPESEIDQLQVITGGIEAQYGDVTGGIISITTKGPSSKFSGGFEAETSNFFDAYNNSLVGINLSGPILKKANGQSLIGFRLAARYTNRLDDDPPGTDIFRINDQTLAELQENPVLNIGNVPFVAADFLTNENVDVLDAQPFEEFTRYDVTAKIDARLSNAIDITLTGSVADEENQFTPNENSATAANWRVLNSHNNPFEFDRTYRGNFRFRHRLGGTGSSSGGEGAQKGALIQNALYTLQFGYEKNLYDHSDSRHDDNYFNYGYTGDFDIEWVPNFQPLDPLNPTAGFEHTGYLQVLRGFTPGAVNPTLANYNRAMGIDFVDGEGNTVALNSVVPEYILAGQNTDFNPNFLVQRQQFLAPNGAVQNFLTDSYGFHTNIGTVYNRVRKEDEDVLTFSANASFDLVPGSSDKGRHSIRLGVWYEERTQRRYDVFPRSLWDLARLRANEHLDQGGIPADSLQRVVVGQLEVDDFNNDGIADTLDLFDIEQAPQPDVLFYQRVREEFGVPLNQYINVDGLDPSRLSLDMFSARELNDFNLLNYYGYDYLGNNFDGTFDDFFTQTLRINGEDTGIRAFPVAPNRPIYQAFYIQDKFTFKDIIFRLGVRVDRYDANTRVLKDPYSLYEIMGAGEFHETRPDIGSRPGNIGDDFKVYLNDSETDVVAYRDGDQWYLSNGTPVNNVALAIAGSQVNPYYKSEAAREDNNYIKSRDFDPNTSFQDYEVQTNVMPRLAFSFPISTEANFFAHYDILVQRPPARTIATALDYFYFLDRLNETKNNPALRPERTIDYEVGFQQKLSNTSAIKIAAYYKEMRDMIQLRTFFPVPIIGQYRTFDNIDFGTVKGFTFQFDLRRTGNLQFNANYTLQFADGTGSDETSQDGLTNRGNLRTLFPLNFDERHRVVANVDYRYSSGKRYNGPRLFGSDILSNFGVNLQTIAVSGRPYTAKQIPSELGGGGTEGSLNGARLPWNFTFNLRVDKQFNLGNRLGANVYVRVQNLLDRRNTIRVYPVTGSPTDDGFLQSSFGEQQVAGFANDPRPLEAYLNSYQWRLLNPNFFSLPRRIFAGVIFDF